MHQKKFLNSSRATNFPPRAFVDQGFGGVERKRKEIQDTPCVREARCAVAPPPHPMGELKIRLGSLWPFPSAVFLCRAHPGRQRAHVPLDHLRRLPPLLQGGASLGVPKPPLSIPAGDSFVSYSFYSSV